MSRHSRAELRSLAYRVLRNPSLTVPLVSKTRQTIVKLQAELDGLGLHAITLFSIPREANSLSNARPNGQYGTLVSKRIFSSVRMGLCWCEPVALSAGLSKELLIWIVAEDDPLLGIPGGAALTTG